jgi:hypothetical protein
VRSDAFESGSPNKDPEDALFHLRFATYSARIIGYEMLPRIDQSILVGVIAGTVLLSGSHTQFVDLQISW